MLEYPSIRKRRWSRGPAAAALPGSGRTAAASAGTASVGPAELAIGLGWYLARPSHACASRNGWTRTWKGAEDVTPGLDRPRVDRGAGGQGAGARTRPGRLHRHHPRRHRRRSARRLVVDIARLRRPRRRPGPAQSRHRRPRRDRAARPVALADRPEGLTRY